MCCRNTHCVARLMAGGAAAAVSAQALKERPRQIDYGGSAGSPKYAGRILKTSLVGSSVAIFSLHNGWCEQAHQNSGRDSGVPNPQVTHPDEPFQLIHGQLPPRDYMCRV